MSQENVAVDIVRESMSAFADGRYSVVHTIRGGKIVRGREYSEKAEALKAVALAEYAMSQDNVEIVRQAVTASQRGDWQAALAFYDHEAELDESRMLDGGVFHGHDRVWSFFRRWFGTWDKLKITPHASSM